MLRSEDDDEEYGQFADNLLVCNNDCKNTIVATRACKHTRTLQTSDAHVSSESRKAKRARALSTFTHKKMCTRRSQLFILHQFVQSHSLGNGAREAIENKTSTTAQTMAAFAHDFPSS